MNEAMTYEARIMAESMFRRLDRASESVGSMGYWKMFISNRHRSDALRRVIREELERRTQTTERETDIG